MDADEQRPLPGGAHETIESVADLERAAHLGRSPHQRWIERITTTIGRPRAVYVVLAASALWLGVNLVLNASGRAIDPPPFAYFDGAMSLAALLMTIVILTKENRTSQHRARRDRLDLQINLLNERKISKVIEMLEALRRDMPHVPRIVDPEAHAMRRSADPAAIARAIDERTPDDA